jgi:hypothetical protein
MKGGAYMETIGDRIRDLRLKHKISQRELAEKILMHPSILTRIEKNTRAIKPDEIEKIASILNVTTDYLLTGVSEKIVTPEDKLIDLLINKTLENKLKWESIENYEKLEINLSISNININIDDLKANFDLWGTGYFSKFNETYFLIFQDFEDERPESYHLFLKLYYGKNLANFNDIAFESRTIENENFHDEAGNSKLIDLFKIISNRSEFLKEIELNTLIEDLENL